MQHCALTALQWVHTLSRLWASRRGSTKRQSRVGRPGSSPLNTEPSGSTSCFRMLKSCLPGLSETYTAAPLTALAAACTAAAGCLLQVGKNEGQPVCLAQCGNQERVDGVRCLIQSVRLQTVRSCSAATMQCKSIDPCNARPYLCR